MRIPAVERGDGNYEAADYRFPLCGASYTSRSVLGGDFVKPTPLLMIEAAVQAARRAAHTLRTGEFAPTVPPGTRFALTPIPSPAEAARLLFESQGRRVLANDIAGLPAEVSSRFAPRLIPLFADAIVAPRVTERALKEMGKSSSDLWTAEGKPNLQMAQALARTLKADYLLLGRVTHTEASGKLPQEGIPLPPKTPALADADSGIAFQAFAEAQMALVRAQDGAILWQDRQEATLSVREEQLRSQRPVSENGILQDAIRFALLGLERSLARYLTSFER
jgi:hypothetical protein